MRIDPENLYRTTQSSGAGASTADRRANTAGPAATPDVQSGALSFSARAETFLSARARLDDAPETSREDRIARLAGLIARGEYVVDGEAVADAMLVDESTSKILGFGPAR